MDKRSSGFRETPTERKRRKAYEFSRTGWGLEHERMENEIIEVRKGLEVILEQIRKDIESGSIQMLIGDDTSGRVPTLMLRSALREIATDQPMDVPPTFFINGPGGGRPKNEQKDRERIDRIRSYIASLIDRKRVSIEDGGKVLLVTEVVKNGRSILPVVTACKELGLTLEVVSIGLENQKSLEQIENELDVPIHVGMTGTPNIYRKPAFSGVVKEEPDICFLAPQQEVETSLFSSPYIDTVPRYNQEDTSLWIKEIRREIQVAAHDLALHFKKHNVSSGSK